MDVFSSRHNTIAFSGGSRYSPHTSMSFSSKCGSVESLNVSTRCGFKPRAAQILCTCAGDTPTLAAIDRTDQCVAPTGLENRVNSTISAIFDSGITFFRPRPGATAPSFFNPSAANRVRHARTVPGVTATTLAIHSLGKPSAAINNTCARCTSRWAATWDFDKASKTGRSASDNDNAAAGLDINPA